MNNKQAIEKIKEYCLTQDKENVCHALAALMIDINRIYYIDRLDEKERHNLQMRMKINIAEMQRFLIEGPDSDFKLMNIDSE